MGSCRPGSSSLNSLEFFAGHVLYYFLHSITLNGKGVQNVFACVLWHKPDENPDRLKLNDFLAHGLSCFLPVQRIYCRFAASETQLEGQKRIVTVPWQTPLGVRSSQLASALYLINSQKT